MNIAIWGQALHGIVRLDKDGWARLDVFARWLIATRAAVLVMTVIPGIIAGVWAYRDGAFDLGLCVWVTLGLVMAHATNNILNDLTDYVRGVDKGNYFRAQYGVQPLEHGLMTIRQSLTYAAVTGAIALAIGGYLVYERGTIPLILMGVGAFFVLFYTWPLKYIGLGEVAVLLVWGPLMTGGAYYVIVGRWSWTVTLLSLPYALGPTTVLFGKHIDKLEADREKHIRTLPVLLGERIARFAVLAMMVLQYLLVFYLVARGIVSPTLLVVVLTLREAPLVWLVYKDPRPATRPEPYPAEVWPLFYVALAFLHCRNFGLYFLGGLIADVALRTVLFGG